MKQSGALGWPRGPSSLEVGLGCTQGGALGRSMVVAECIGLLRGNGLFSRVLKLHADHEWAELQHPGKIK